MSRHITSKCLLSHCLGLALLAGCQGPMPTATQAEGAMPLPESAPIVPSVPSGTTPNPDAVAPKVFDLSGKADVFGQPFAGAEVKVYAVGTATALATTQTAGDGSFALDLAGTATAGTLLKVLATKDQKTVATLIIAPDEPKRRQTLAQGRVDVELDAATTLTVAVFNDKLRVTPKAAAAAAIANAFQRLLKESSKAVGAATSEALKIQVLQAIAPDGSGRLSQSTFDALAKANPTFRTEASNTNKTVDKALTPAAGGGGSGGSGGGGETPATETATGGVNLHASLAAPYMRPGSGLVEPLSDAAWMEALSGPIGLAVSNDFLTVADGTRLLHVELASGDVVASTEVMQPVLGIGRLGDRLVVGAHDALISHSHAGSHLVVDEFITDNFADPGYSDGLTTYGRFRFGSQMGLADDGAGNLYVADPANNRIRFVSVASDPPRVSTIAGSGATGAGNGGYKDGAPRSALFDQPTGVAYDPVNRVLYVADSGNHRIRKITFDEDGNALAVTTFAGSTRGHAEGVGRVAQFDSPQGVAIDAAGNVYVADTGNHRVRKITTEGAVTTLAGDGEGRLEPMIGDTSGVFMSPTAVAVDADGNVYVADTGHRTIMVIRPLIQ